MIIFLKKNQIIYKDDKINLKKLEKEFIKEAKTLTNKEFEDIKKQKVVKAILLSYSKN